MLDDDIREALLGPFREEAAELLAELESALLEMEKRPDDSDLVSRAFRALHTIKGNGAMFGFFEIESFAHELEKVFDKLREGETRASKELIDLALGARDQINVMLQGAGDDPAAWRARKELLEAIQRLEPGEAVNEEIGNDNSGTSPAEAILRVRFRPFPEVLSRSADLLGILRELRGLGHCRVMALVDEVPPLAEIDPTRFHLGWDIVLITSRSAADVRKAFSVLEGELELEVVTVEQADDLAEEAGERMLGEILIERGDLDRKDLKCVLGERKLFGELLVEKGLAEPKKVESALAEQQAVRDLRAKRVAKGQASTIRVNSHKLDGLVDLVGELVTVQARLSRLEREYGSSELTTISEEVERLTWELRDSTFSIRMVPIGTTFSKFRRLVRDLADEMGRKADLVTEGAATELDKTVIEKLNDPLVHLIRNSIGHGIESPEVRRKAGKSGTGSVRIAASQSGADIVIEISDDGAGLDMEAIVNKAVERNLIEEGTNLSRQDISALIFLPGFSTAREVNNVSGRGVGLDVVKSSIESLQGTVQVASEAGKGTTYTIRLPLTLAIIDGLEVAIGDERFVMPLSYVEECIELNGGGEGNGSGRTLTNVRGDLVPYIKLRNWFHVPGRAPSIEQIVVTRTEGSRVGLVVDYVVGEHQTVIKSLGKVYRGIEGFSGATILGDGRVALLLDVPHLVKGAEEEEVVLFGG